MKSKPTRLLALASVTAALSTLNAAADTYQWDGNAVGNDSNWATASNWSTTEPFTVPADADISGAHRLNVNGAATLIYSADQGTCNFTGDGSTRGLAVGNATSGTMEITGGSFSTLNAIGQDVIGNGNNVTGTLIISGGVFIGSGAGTRLGIGGSSGSGRVSTLTLSGSGLATLTSLIINSNTINIDLDGGTLELNSFTTESIGTLASIRLNGGVLKARQSTTNFISSNANLEALVQSGGAIIDTNSFDITINEPLLEDFGSLGGGLTKNGEGLLTLAAPSTVSGAITVNAGGLGVKGNDVDSWFSDSFTHSGDTLSFDLGSTDPLYPPPIDTALLTVDSAVTVNVTGSGFTVGQFPLIEYATKTITGSLTLNPASLPTGVVATLEDDGLGLIYLDVTAIPAPPPGFPVNDTFDAGTGNWYKAANSGSLTNVTGRLRWAENGSNMAEVIGRSFDAQTLTVGQTMRLTFDFTWSAGTGNILRAGLYNVTNPIAADNWAGSNAIGAWEGYYTFVRDASASGNVARRDAAASASEAVGPTNGGTTITVGTNTTNFDINGTAAVTYQGTFEVTYVSPTQVDTLFTLKEGEITRFSVPGTTSTIYNTFNTVVIKTGANGPIAFFDNVKVEIPAAIASGFGSWIIGTFSGGPVPGGQLGPNDDPDNDGIDNLLEFVLNGDPTVSDPSILPSLDASGSNFVFTYTRRDDSLSPETTQTFQYGSDLVGWTNVIVPAGNATVGAATITVTDGTPADTVEISIPKTEALGSGKLFGRLQVEQ